MRIVWGFVGTRYARFSDFVRSPRVVVRYLRDNLRGQADYYLGHNPAGGLMAIALIVSLLVTTGAGMVLLAADEGEGPLAGWLVTAGERPQGSTETEPVSADRDERESEESKSPLAESAEEVHEFFANLTLALVLLHILGVIVESLRERQNLARAMVTGHKRRER